MRCLALAQAWQDAGGAVAFASADLPDSLFERLKAERYALNSINAARGTEGDVEETRRLAESVQPRWLVLDGYAFGPAFQLAIRDVNWRLLLIDDDGRHEGYHVDALLNQNAGAAAAGYGRRVHGARLLLGCQYAMLRREFFQVPRRLTTSPSVSRILITLGGADWGNVTERCLSVLQPCVPPECEIHVLLGPANPHVATMRKIASTQKQVVLHVAPGNVAPIMAECDLAISASGSSVYELGYLGVPMLLVVTADNQRPIAAALDHLGAAVRVDELGQNQAADLPSALESLISDPVRRGECAEKFRELVDGQGAARVIGALRELSGVP
jgi:UDP-2,4-diacetamido-2,4,6-trideoxy-beta-L-altropyranose hydrolase